MTPFAERFQIVRMVGEGGMGSVYQGVDKQSGGMVALKIFRTQGQEQRFEREAELLAACDDESIVRYIAHGETDTGELYIAMEWLDGIDLSTRLEKGALSPEDSLEVAIRAAQALQHAHERGIIHRDVKPSNVFLVGGDSRKIKLIDFGVARAKSKRALTRTNVFLGTVGYMAPEQVMGLPDIDGRADVFSLGCVLYECLTGVPAYASDEPLSVFAKLLVDEPPRLSKTRPELNPSLDSVLVRMLTRQRDQRYRSMAEVLTDLRAVAAGNTVALSLPRVERNEIGERRVVSFIAVDNGVGSSGDRTVTPDQLSGATGEVIAVSKSLGLNKVVELDGIIVLGTWEGGARDRALRAVTCAMAIAEAFPQISVGVATGASDTFSDSADSEVIRRALGLARAGRNGHGIPVDELTADLASESFAVATEGQVLRARRAANQDSKTTPLVGRQRELAYLETSLMEVSEEQMARAVVVVGAEGAGKTRLVQAFLDRNDGKCLVLRAAGNAATAVEPFSLLRQMVVDSEDLPPPSMQRRAPISEVSVLQSLQTSTGQPPVPDVVAKAVATWLRRVQSRRFPTVLVIEDAQWADPPSLSAIGTALRSLENVPVLMIATTRPAGRVVAGALLSWAHTTELRLQPLSSRAAEALLRALLDKEPSDDLIERIIASADGNAFSLGMLARYVNRTGSAELPNTVLALVVARFETLKDDERAVVRVASLFGRSFPAEAIAGVLRKDLPTVERILSGLAAEDIVTEGVSTVYRFRHEMYARAAYEMISSASRPELHRTAAEVLTQNRASPLVVAHQYRYAGMNEEAAEWYVRVADAATHKLTGAPRLDSDSSEEGEVEMSRAHAAIMHCHDDRLGVEWLLRAFSKARVGSHAWWRGVPLAVALSQAGPAVQAIVADVLPRLSTASLPASREFIRDLPDIVWLFGSLGLGRIARNLLDRVDEELLPRKLGEPLMELSYALLEYHGPGLLGDVERTLESATRAALEVGERAGALNGRLYLGLVQGFSGRLEEGIATLTDVIEFDEHAMITRSAKSCRSMLLGMLGHTAEAFRDLEAAEGDQWLALFTDIQRFMILQGAGRIEAAKEISQRVYNAYVQVPLLRTAAGIGLAEHLLELGEYEAALPVIDDGLAVVSSKDEVAFSTFHYRYLAMRAKCLTALGADGAAQATHLAFERVSADLGSFPTEESREAFRSLPLVSWTLASAAPKPKKLGLRDTAPVFPRPS